MWFIYIAKCSDGAYYTGVTNNLTRRAQEHKRGDGGFYTNYNRPMEIVHVEEFILQTEAIEREKQIKKWTKAKKEALIKGEFKKLKILSKSREI